MKQKLITSAFLSLMKLNNAQLPIREAYNVYKLRRQLEDSYDFAAERERAVIDKYNGVVAGAQINFPENTDMEAVQNELIALNELDVAIEFTPVELSLEKLGDSTLSPNDIAALEGFIIWQ